MGIPLRKEERAFTYADYKLWPDEERWELIDGAAYDMSPENLRMRRAPSCSRIFRLSATKPS